MRRVLTRRWILGLFSLVCGWVRVGPCPDLAEDFRDVLNRTLCV